MAAATVSHQHLRDFIAGVYRAAGVPEAQAGIVAGLMAQADLIGADGHGVFRLPQYVRRIRAGGMNATAVPRIVQERPGAALVDGDNGLGHLATRLAAETAIAKARTQGVAWCGVRNGNHAGPASLYARMVQEAGMIGLYLAVGSANHLPPWGGLELLLSTNPIAVAVPAGEEPPVVLDMATTVAAYGKVKVKAQRGEAMPEGWMIDREGRPLTDPARANEGLLLPIGGYKGYGLALIFGLLAGTLNGAAMGRDVVDFNADDTTVTNTGQAVLAIDIAAFGDPAAFRAQVDALARDIRGSARLPGVDRIWLPGEQSRLTRLRREAEGVPIPPALRAQLDALAAELGAALLPG
ncbi:Ldh family oxidoreductase [Paracraurococcus ruber]|uniref:Lactate dehydrogenase n=1 Tax=Paracraurococcus ruber TaxID=77675 RepID=A0ABS1CU77_9PROT|nr:Ldh family oxidoreductase [Paracraurococcus ruber]MBK1657939.1 lactate dehydrogenase [Paracraurococcus ruber]TDG31623.1 Ldh family oxidoreductase [Paracraurococcus ruber]